MEARIHGTTKRQREESDDSPLILVGSKTVRLDSPESNLISPDLTDSASSDVKSVVSKRIGVDLSDESGFGSFQEDLMKILDEGDGSVVRESAIPDLESVIRSFEKEIQVPVPVPDVQAELGYLLQASDDELGLPPAGGVEDVDFGDEFYPGGLGFEDGAVSNFCWLEGEEEGGQVVALGGLFDDCTDGTAAEWPPYRSEMMYCL